MPFGRQPTPVSIYEIATQCTTFADIGHKLTVENRWQSPVSAI